jgi:hypothetical protein
MKKLHIEMRSRSDTVKEQLEREGWHVDTKQDGSMLATHSGVIQEPEVRQRLDQMGLLTSSQVKIEFVLAKEPEV